MSDQDHFTEDETSWLGANHQPIRGFVLRPGEPLPHGAVILGRPSRRMFLRRVWRRIRHPRRKPITFV